MAVALDRRRFLKVSAGLALGLGLAQVPGRVAASATPRAAGALTSASDGVW